MEVHGDIDKIERKVKEDMDINLTIHVDPILLDDTQTEMYQTLFDEAIEEAGKGAWTMHDFWIRPRKHRVDVYFDLVVPYEERRNEEELSSAILSKIKVEEPISLFIEIDHPIGLK